MSTKHFAIEYRPDIDGLRAVAVLSVVFFHAFPDLLPGGFIGVDVFFVISGFLISSILIRSLESRSFSFGDFYRRRVRRIFPALLLVLTSCLIFGWFALLTDEYRQLGNHVAAGAGFVSNLVLLREAGYFDNLGETKPLLHLWSLAVEEQFYLFWPFVLWWAHKQRIALLKVSVLVIGASFLWNVLSISNHPTSTFYSPLTRFWEILSGSCLASLSFRKPVISRKLREVFSLLGALLLLLALVLIRRTSQFPGFWALLPVLGTWLIIFAGPGSFLNSKFLSCRFMVAIGIVSYPLYLWHWPLLSYARVIQSEAPGPQLATPLVLLAFLLAFLTYQFVEKPLRSPRYLRPAFVPLLVTMVLLLFLGGAVSLDQGVSWRKNAQIYGLDGDIGDRLFFKYIGDRYFICTPASLAKKAPQLDGFTRCMQSKQNSDVDIALVGDSHAEHFFLGMAEAFSEKNIAFYVGYGPPYLGKAPFDDIFAHLTGNTGKSIKSIIIAARYAAYGGKTQRELVALVKRLQATGKKVYVADDVPHWFAPQRCKGKRWLSTKDPICTIDSNSVWYDEGRRIQGIVDNVASEVAGARPLHIWHYFCDSSSCRMSKGNQLMFRDDNHLNINGSLYLGKKIFDDYPELRN